MRFTKPIFEKMLRRIREQLGDIQQVGSLLRIECELRGLVEEQRRNGVVANVGALAQGLELQRPVSASLHGRRLSTARDSSSRALLGSARARG